MVNGRTGEVIAHIPDYYDLQNEERSRRVLFPIQCAICKRDFEVRDGGWIPTYTKMGTEIHLKVCIECYAVETASTVEV